MEKMLHKFYQCGNANCGLRFPGYDGSLRWNRCPLCRSEIHLVATIEKSEGEHKNFILPSYPVDALIDNVRSALNIGSIFRTAEGTGINKLYLCGITPTPDNPKVCKTALGAEASVPWKWFANGLEATSVIKDNGYEIWALENTPTSISLFQIELPKKNKPIVLVVGNEVNGIDPGIIEASDQVVSIPMAGEKSSYNVAIAFGIAVSFLIYCQSFSQGSRNILPKT